MIALISAPGREAEVWRDLRDPHRGGGGALTPTPLPSAHQFFSVRIVCDSCGRAMDITWLRSLLTKDWKLGWPRYPGSREKRGLELGPGKSEVRRGGEGDSPPREALPPCHQHPGLPGAPLSSAPAQVPPSFRDSETRSYGRKGLSTLGTGLSLPSDQGGSLSPPDRGSLCLPLTRWAVSPYGPDPLEAEPYLLLGGFHSLPRCP